MAAVSKEDHKVCYSLRRAHYFTEVRTFRRCLVTKFKYVGSLVLNIPSENTSESDAIEEFKQEIQESAVSRADTELIEIREITPTNAIVVVKEELSTPSGTLYRIRKESTMDDGFDLHWKFIEDMELE